MELSYIETEDEKMFFPLGHILIGSFLGWAMVHVLSMPSAFLPARQKLKRLHK